jgi:MFS family permease
MYKEHQAAVIGYLEMSAGIGVTIAPVVGSFIYNLYGYHAPFIFYGVIFLFFAIILKAIIPYKFDIRHEEEPQIEEDEPQLNSINEEENDILEDEVVAHKANVRFEEDIKLTYCGLIMKSKIFFGCFSGCLAYFFYS